MKKTLLTLASSMAFLMLATTSTKAAIISVSGQGSIIEPPNSVLKGANRSLDILGFDEKQGVLLTSDLMVDDGVISAGTKVNSHLIFFSPQTRGFSNAVATWQFNGRILGVISDRPGSLEFASSPILGNSTTLYPNGRIGARGLEGIDRYELINPNTLELTAIAKRPGDYIRVVTAVPEPMTILGIGTAVGFGGFFKRKIAKQQADKQNQA